MRVSQQIEQELNRIHFELTEDNEEEVLKVSCRFGYSTVFLHRLQNYDTEVVASQTVTAWAPEPKSDAEYTRARQGSDKVYCMEVKQITRLRT